MLSFIKMHGLGNDFVIIDGRGLPVVLSASQIQEIANRRTGVGCDQLVIMERSDKADVLMRIFNADGGEIFACGNATRCVGFILMAEKVEEEVTIETKARLMIATRASNGWVTVDMGAPKLKWRNIPLSEERDTLHLGIENGPLKDPVGVSMGNPHAVFFVPDAQEIPLSELGPALEHHELFPERANIGGAQVLDSNTIRLRVFERGVGETEACGTGACAALVAACRRGLTEHKATIQLRGGNLDVQWKEDGHVLMSGAVAESFRGTIELL